MANLTQEELAERAGLSVHAISMLERGVRQTPRPSTVELLAEALKLEASQRRALVTAARSLAPPALQAEQPDARPVTPPEPRSGIPPDPTAHFVGREAELAELQWLLERSGRVVVHGLSGIGKTQLVARHAQQRRAHYADGVFWLRADHDGSLVGDLASLTWRLGLPEREAREQERQVEAVLRWLGGHPRWLIVLDNLESACQDAVAHWLPTGLPGRLLTTSRTPLGSVTLQLDPLPPEIAGRYLLQRTRQADVEAARAVAEMLGRLPLALAQAAAYLAHCGRDLASYADLLRTHLVELMEEGRPDDYRLPLATTLRLSYEGLEEAHPAAAALLRLLAFLAPDDVPVSVLQAGAAELPEGLSEDLEDGLRFDRTVAALRRQSLVERLGDQLSVHRLVQAVVRESLEPGQRERWQAAAIRLLNVAVLAEPADDQARWPLGARLVAHAHAVEQLTRDRTVEPGPLGRVLERTGMYLWARGEFAQARPLVERSVAIRERALGPDHPDTATSLDSLALLLGQQGHLAASRPLFERALAIREVTLGPDHLATALSLNNLASLLREQGDPAAARPLYERALAIRERALGPGHLRTANSLNNLANVLCDQSDLAGAMPLIERALAICERELGPEHAYTALCLSNLARLHRAQGDLGAARRLHERALVIRERVLGPEHPATGRCLHLLATTLWVQQGPAAARPLLQRAAAIYVRALSPDHPWAIECRRTLEEVTAELALP